MGIDVELVRVSRRRMLRGVTAGLGSLVDGVLGDGVALAQRSTSVAQVPADPSATVTPITVSARRLASFSRASSAKTFGRLEFLGGLVLTSQATHFGGFSGLVMEPDGRGFIALSDEGHWLSGQLTYDANGVSGMEKTVLGPIVATSGKSLWRKRDQDCEAVALLEGTLTRGTLLLAFERNHRIGRFPVVDRKIGVPSGYLKMPSEAKRMASNRGLEAMTVMAGGPFKSAVIAISERFPGGANTHKGWLWINGEPREFTLTDKNGFEITDVASLGDGSLLILERRFRWTEGVHMQVRLVPAAEVRPGGVLNGELLLEAGMTAEIDNMEALAVHKGPSGETILTLMSDDNFNGFLQRTILLQFKLA